MKRISRARVIYTRSGRGLREDAQLVLEILKSEGWGVSVKSIIPNYRYQRFVYLWERFKLRLPRLIRRLMDRVTLFSGRLRLEKFDLQIHLENPFVTFIGASTENWLIPNQEWAKMHQLQYLPHLSRILCKTKEAVRAYQDFNPNVCYIGFSSRSVETVVPSLELPDRFNRCLHVAGNNRKKGTGIIVEAWRKNPKWPTLHLVIDQPERFGILPSNVKVLCRPSATELQAIRRECGIVLAPSEVEGFGHVIVEGLIWGAVTITTDAPPMNELITSERGVLISPYSSTPCRLGAQFFVNVTDLESTMNDLFDSQHGQLLALATAGLRWVHDNHFEFLSRFKDALRATGK